MAIWAEDTQNDFRVEITLHEERFPVNAIIVQSCPNALCDPSSSIMSVQFLPKSVLRVQMSQEDIKRGDNSLELVPGFLLSRDF